MATTPDPHPDSRPTGPSESPEQVSQPAEPGRETVEDVPTVDVADLIRAEDEPGRGDHVIEDAPGDYAGTMGTGGYVQGQDQ